MRAGNHKNTDRPYISSLIGCLKGSDHKCGVKQGRTQTHTTSCVYVDQMLSFPCCAYHKEEGYRRKRRSGRNKAWKLQILCSRRSHSGEDEATPWSKSRAHPNQGSSVNQAEFEGRVALTHTVTARYSLCSVFLSLLLSRSVDSRQLTVSRCGRFMEVFMSSWLQDPAQRLTQPASSLANLHDTNSDNAFPKKQSSDYTFSFNISII